MSIGYPQTGFALNASETGTTVLTSAHYQHDGIFNMCTKKIDKKTLNNVGRNGPTAVVNGKEISTIADFTLPEFGTAPLAIYRAAGLSAVTANSYVLGNPILSGTNAGRTSIASLTVEQSTDRQRTTLKYAKPTNLSLEWKAGEIINLKGGLQGESNTLTSGLGYIRQQTPITSASPVGGTSVTLTINGVAVDHTEGKLDFGIVYEHASDASSSTGMMPVGEITQYSPKLDVTILADANTFAFLNSIQSSTVPTFDVSLAYGNRTWSGTGYFSGEYDFSLDGNIITNKFSIMFYNSGSSLLGLTLS